MKKARSVTTTIICLAVLAGVSAGHAAVTITLDRAQKYQTIEGFGAHMDIGPWKVKSGPFYEDVDLRAEGVYDSLISELGATVFRIFLPPEFQATQGAFDPSTLHSRIHTINELLSSAHSQSEPLNFFASVLSPPAWMKVNGTTTCADGVALCRLIDGMEGDLATHLRMALTTLRDSTDYAFYALSIQNEAAFPEPYESCVYNGTRYRDVLKVVASHFRQHGMNTRFIGAEHMSWAFPSQFESEIRNDPVALADMHAWAVHGYTDGVETDTGAYAGTTPTDKPLWMTETQGAGYGTSPDDWNGAMTLAGNILSYLRDARITLWTWGSVQSVCGSSGCTESQITGGLLLNGTPTAKYYAARHFYRFIRPGARQIASTSSDGDVEVVAFYHEEHHCWSVVLRNRSTSHKTIGLSGTGIPSQWTMEASTASSKRASSDVTLPSEITIPASSVVTLVAGAYVHTEQTSSVRPLANRAGTVPSDAERASYCYGLTGRRIAAQRALRGVVVGPNGLKVYVRTDKGPALTHF